MRFIVIPFLLLLLTSMKAPVLQTHTYQYENVLGTSFELKVLAYTQAQADVAETAALEEVDRLQQILSTYQPSSEISMWLKTKDQPQHISKELFEVLGLFDEWRDRTNGALTASVSQASDVWNKAARTELLPSSLELAEISKGIQQPQWRLNAADHTATHLTNESLVLNTFVKSYIIEKVRDRLMATPGVKGIVVNIGGDIMVAGEWTESISIAHPSTSAENGSSLAQLRLKDQFIATSGNYRRGFEVNGQWYSHIIDGRTAIPSSSIISATVISDRATDAGALATAFNILTPDESAALASRVGNVEYILVTSDMKTIASPGWSKRSDVTATTHLPQATDFEAAIELELAQFEGRFRRPFVAVWVEDKKKESVRTLAVWYNKPRWLPDLKRWFNKNQDIAQDFQRIGSISSATRSAGKYTLVWDGLNDVGTPVPEGRYTIYIEAAREHGTYQLIKQEIDWNKKPQHLSLEGGVEVTSASIDLRATNK